MEEHRDREPPPTMAFHPRKLKFKNVVSEYSSDDEKDTENDLRLRHSFKKQKLGPRKKLLVLGLGGLLAHRRHRRYEITIIPMHHRPDVVYGPFLVFKRPFCDEFLKFCFERFEVGIWASATKRNINDVLSIVMGGLRSKLLFVWGQEECTETGFESLEKKGKPIFFKEFRKLWESDSTLQWPTGQYTSSNTLLIDDEPYSGLLNPPNTAIFPRQNKLDDIKDTFLGPKGELQLFLDGLADAEDVPSYVKNNPFGQPAVSPSHSDWDYYSKIILKFNKRGARDVI